MIIRIILTLAIPSFIYTSSLPDQPSQITNLESISTDSQQNIGMIYGEPITYLKNVLTFDILLQFIESNMTRSLKQLRNEMESIIQQERRTGQKGELKKNACWFCQKEFKNSTFLAMHYLVKHSNKFATQNPSFFASHTPLKTIQQILKQPLYSLISAAQLQLLLSSPNKHQTYEQCLTILNVLVTSMSSSLQRYSNLNNMKHRIELCSLLAFKLQQRSILVQSCRYFMLVVFGVVGTCYFYYWIESTLRTVSKQKHE